MLKASRPSDVHVSNLQVNATELIVQGEFLGQRIILRHHMIVCS
jgi:hypothetical protein